jgi:hypothetical protein
MNRHLLSLGLMAFVACDQSGAAREVRDEAEPSVSAQDDALSAAQRPPAPDKLLSELNRPQARALCQEVDRHVDLCAVAGRRLGYPTQCNAAVEMCRAQEPGPSTDCRDARFDFPEPCTATVQDYLTCVERFTANTSCAFDRFGPDPTPEECAPLLAKCPSLEADFGAASAIVPRCAANSPPRVDENDDVVGLDCGRPLPTRMVTLGDSIAFCLFPSGFSDCAPTLVSDYVREHYAPLLQYQSLAVPGVETPAVLEQARRIAPGPGHLLVWIWVGGNEMARCSRPTLPETRACIDTLLAGLPATWEQIFSYFDDRSRFPDGVSFMLNTQYSLYDQCVHPLGPERMEFAEATIQRFNRDVIMSAALARDNVVAVDQYPDFLGHANQANHNGCPHCSRDDNALWLLDGTHPNNRGNHHIADKWKVAIDRAYGACQ